MATVNVHVHLVHPETREVVRLAPGDTVPEGYDGALKNRSLLSRGDTTDEDPEDLLGDSSLTDLKVTELRERLETLGLPTDGNKPDLIERLRQA